MGWKRVLLYIFRLFSLLLMLSTMSCQSVARSSFANICDEAIDVLPKEIIIQLIDEHDNARFTYRGKTFFYYAAILGLHEKLKKWSSKDIVHHVEDDILVATASAGDLVSLQFMIASGFDPDQASDTGVTPLISAADCGRTDVMLFLIDAGANIQARDHQGLDALIASIMVRNVNGVRLLLENGFNVNLSRTGSGLTPIDVARKKDNRAILNMLSEAMD